MTAQTTGNESGRLTRGVVGGVVVLVLAVAAAWLLRGTEEDAPTNTSGAGMAGMDMSMPGMDMSGGGSVSLTADQIRDFGVTFGTVEVRVLEDVVRSVGIVTFDETRISSITARFDGYVERLLVDYTGKQVREGEPMLEVYSPELLAVQEELLLAARLEDQLAGATLPGSSTSPTALVDAARQRLLLQGVSEREVDQIVEEGRAHRALTLYSAVAGVVTEKNVVAGQSIMAGQSLYTVADLSQVWLEAEVREADAGLVRVGEAVSVEISAFPGRPLSGRIDYVYPTVETQTRTLKARVALPNPEGSLRPGMYATTRIQSPGRSALTVPASAVFDTGERRIVFVDMGSGGLAPTDVEIGRVAGDLVEVVAGLEPGQRVVTSAQYLLDSESNLADVMRSMIGQMSTSDMGSTDMPGMPMPAREP